MKSPLKILVVLSILVLIAPAQAKIIVVNTDSLSANFHQGQTNFGYAISVLADGDTIQFNIPNTTTNKHYLPSPGPSGYPVITANNVTIDGYTQPGASASTNTIIAPNNAQIRIVLDARNGILSNYNPDPSGGFGSHELAVLFVQGTNCHIRGLCFLGPGQVFGGNDNYGVGVTYLANDTHVSGCWFGVDLDGIGIFPFEIAVAAFGGGVLVGTNTVPMWPQRTIVGVKPGPPDTAGARAQHNIFCGQYFALDIESRDSHISGNFFNVLPDGMHDVGQDAFPMESMMEYGREINNLVIGTDGDGNNDAEERNVFGGVTATADNNIIEIYGAGSDPIVAVTNMVIAGNYFGLAVDGVTRFTNSMNIIDNFRSENGITGTWQFGSDFDGVSDAIEGNVIYMNNPFTTLFPNPGLSVPPNFVKSDAGPQVSVRGNILVNNNVAPFSYADGSGGGRFAAFTNYEASYMNTNGSIIPNLASNSSTANITGTCALPNGILYTNASGAIYSYSNIIVDVYSLDPEGWTNGMQFQLFELAILDSNNSVIGYNGFPQGRAYLGSFLDNGPLDADPAVGSFSFNASALGLASGTTITVTANYSADPPGTHHGRTHTSNFSNPVTLRSALRITAITRNGAVLTINWTGGAGPYTLQKKTAITGTWNNLTTGITGTSTTDTISSPQAFYRVVGN